MESKRVRLLACSFVGDVCAHGVQIPARNAFLDYDDGGDDDDDDDDGGDDDVSVHGYFR